MAETRRGIALLSGIATPLAMRLADALDDVGLDAVAVAAEGNDPTPPELPHLTMRLHDPASIETQLASLGQSLRVLINHAAQPLAVPTLDGRSMLPDLAYAPYELYRAAIRHLSSGGQIVSLFGDTTPTPEPRALTLPALRKITQDLKAEAAQAGVRMNGVSVKYVEDASEAERERILEERVHTIVRLAAGGSEADGEFFRGYAARGPGD